MRDWPKEASTNMSGVQEILDNLRRAFRKEAATLFRELNLNIQVTCANLNWLLLVLAEYQMESRALAKNAWCVV